MYLVCKSTLIMSPNIFQSSNDSTKYQKLVIFFVFVVFLTIIIKHLVNFVKQKLISPKHTSHQEHYFICIDKIVYEWWQAFNKRIFCDITVNSVLYTLLCNRFVCYIWTNTNLNNAMTIFTPFQSYKIISEPHTVIPLYH